MWFQVHAAYKRALLRFHPDRKSKTDVRQQVEAEEKFKAYFLHEGKIFKDFGQLDVEKLFSECVERDATYLLYANDSS